MVMVNLGSTDDSRYTGYREITDRDVLDLQCTGVTNCVNPGQTAPKGGLIWVCTVCIFHFVRLFGVRNFRIFTILGKIRECHEFTVC